MTKESLLMQYQSECRNALESVVNISKSFQKVFMDAMKLFMAIPDRINPANGTIWMFLGTDIP